MSTPSARRAAHRIARRQADLLRRQERALERLYLRNERHMEREYKYEFLRQQWEVARAASYASARAQKAQKAQRARRA
jgi:hypothetical protein